MSNSSKRYQCTLNEEDLAKAVAELHEPENNDERLRRIDQLRDAYVAQSPNLALAQTDDAFILRFLRARKFDHGRALKMLRNYHSQRNDWPEVFDKVKNPGLVRHVFDAGCFISINAKAKNGSAVCIGRPGKVENPLLTDFVATLTITVENMLEDERNQIYGVTVIEDLSYFSFEMAQQMGPSVGKRFVGWLQDAMPVRVKSVNMVNEPTLFDVVFAIVRPFMKDKMKKRMTLHGNKFDMLHKIIDPAVLPPAYGGTHSNLDEIAHSWRDVVYGEDTYL